MKGTWIYILSISLTGSSILTGCEVSSSYNYMGTIAGAEIGGVIGESIGRMTTNYHDGPGKAMLGNIIGTVAGAAFGNTITKDKNEITQVCSDNNRNDIYNEGCNTDYQTGGGADYSYSNIGNSKYNSDKYNNYNSILSINNVIYQDEDGNGKFGRNETVNIIYEVTNNSHQTIKDVLLAIEAINNIKCFALSPSNTINIGPGETIRYQAKAFCKSKPSESITNFKVSAKSSVSGKISSEMQIRMDK